MYFGRWRSSEDNGHEINLTPLIDVSLVLVVMLLLATPLAFESSINVNKGETTAQESEATDQDERIEILVGEVDGGNKNADGATGRTHSAHLGQNRLCVGDDVDN